MNTKKMIFKGVLALMILMPFVSAQGACGFGWHEQGGVCVRDYLVNASTIVISITFLLIGIGYMIGRVIENTRLLKWSETELYELMWTAFILALYLSGSSILDNVIGPAFSGTSLAYPGEIKSGGAWEGSVEAHVAAYIQGELNFIKEKVIKNIIRIASVAGVLSTSSLILSTGPTMMSVPIAPAFGGLQQFLVAVVGAVAVSAIQLKVQFSVVALWPGLFNVLLPLGIAFRAFPFTRTAGGAMIAIAVGFTIILPITYLLVEDISTHYWNTSGCAQEDLSAQELLRNAFRGVARSLGGTGGGEDAIKNYMFSNKFSCMIFRVGMEAMILPFFAYLMTLNVTRRLAEIMGAHIDFSALIRII